MLITRMKNKLKRKSKKAVEDFVNNYYVVGTITDLKKGKAEEESIYLPGAIMAYQRIKEDYK